MKEYEEEDLEGWTFDEEVEIELPNVEEEAGKWKKFSERRKRDIRKEEGEEE